MYTVPVDVLLDCAMSSSDGGTLIGRGDGTRATSNRTSLSSYMVKTASDDQ